MILSLQEKLGCSHDYILWSESWTNLQMKVSDAPRIGKEKKKMETEDDFREFFNIHE